MKLQSVTPKNIRDETFLNIVIRDMSYEAFIIMCP